MELNTLHLFAGAGGGIIADQLLGHRVIGAVEIEAYPRKVLLARQLDGSLPRFPIWDDVTTFRSDNPECSSYIARLRALQNLCICGGFPCQDISSAGKGAGIEGERSGLWSEFARIIGEIMPRYVFVENSPMLTIRGLGTVLRDLAALGFDAEWGVLSARDVGARNVRERIWIYASNTNCNRLQGRKKPNTSQGRNTYNKRVSALVQNFTWLDVSNPHAYGSNVGLAYRVDRTKAIGNGQVPLCAATAFNLLRERLVA